MAREVPAAQVLGDQDVRVAELGLGSGVATLGVGDRGRVVGRVASLPLVALVRIAGTRWRVEPAFQAGKALCGLDEHQVHWLRWSVWRRRTRACHYRQQAAQQACRDRGGTQTQQEHHAR